MEPIDHIRAAIAKLEDVREHSTQGDWYAEGFGLFAQADDALIMVARMDVAADDATRIAVLANRNVLNVQLSMLTSALDFMVGGHDLGRFEIILDLADAINSA